MEQYFIKIAPKLDVVSCGKFDTSANKSKFVFHKKANKSEFFSSEYALTWLNNEIEALGLPKSKVLFYVHGFWASLSFPLNRTVQAFNKNYFKSEQDDISAIIHIVWNANALYYKNSISSLKKSKFVFNEILNDINNKISKNVSLMCHSMGNRFLYESLKHQKVNTSFKELLLVAPDLHFTHFESGFQMFSDLADKVYVLYHTKDKTLKMSKIINKTERLGRVKLIFKDSNISFIDLTHINDIKSVADKVMRHNYFIYSDTVRLKIEKLLKNNVI